MFTPYKDIQPKRTGKLRLQADLEFKQNQIKKLNDEFNVDMFSHKSAWGKNLCCRIKNRTI